jgi:hypothetical protein
VCQKDEQIDSGPAMLYRSLGTILLDRGPSASISTGRSDGDEGEAPNFDNLGGETV